MVGFIENTKDDLATLYSAIKDGTPPGQKQKVSLAGIRMVGLITAGASALWLIKILSEGFLSEGQGLLKLAVSVSTFVLGYDLFRLGENISAQNNTLTSWATAIKSGASMLNAAVQGGSIEDVREANKIALAKELTKNMIAQPLWVKIHSGWLGPIVEKFTPMAIQI